MLQRTRYVCGYYRRPTMTRALQHFFTADVMSSDVKAVTADGANCADVCS